MMSIEAGIAFATLIIIIAAIPTQTPRETTELFESAKAKDLLTIWAREKSTESEMYQDADIFIGKGKYSINETEENRILSVFEMKTHSIFGTRILRLELHKN